MHRPHCYRSSDKVLIREVDDGAVLLDLGMGYYFGLDPIGLRIWQLIDQGHSHDQIVSVLLQEYSVSMSQLEKDVDALVAGLLERGLIHPN